jgi:hypothetical protein
MRGLLVVMLIGCGGTGFVPVTVTLDSEFFEVIGVEATKKLNPSCATNCELGVAIEDGGCQSVRVGTMRVCDSTCRDVRTYTCEGTGGVYAPDYVGKPDGGPPYTSTPRNIAVGAELLVYSTSTESCRKTYSVPARGLDVHVSAASDGGCSFTP